MTSKVQAARKTYREHKGRQPDGKDEQKNDDGTRERTKERKQRRGENRYGLGTKDRAESWTRPTFGNFKKIAALLVYQTTNQKTVKYLVLGID